MVQQVYRTFLLLKYPLAYLTKFYGLIFLRINIDEVNPVDDIKNIKYPILLVHAEEDSQIPVSEAYLLYNAGNKAELWVVKNADHGMTHSINPEEYEERVIGFFKEHIK
jgi:fermentation-respiration switch protein FrsA (DUF1100 family)